MSNILDTFSNDDQNNRIKPVYGVVTGVVTKNHDDQDPHPGCVQVNINTFEDNHVTTWAPVATLMAGSGRGSLFLPEVGDEVLVAFEHGNINAPYVVGALWNGKHKPPEANSEGNNIRKIKSRSGHEIVFDDDSEGKKEKLEIKTNGGHSIVLDDAEEEENVTIESKSGHKVVLDDAPGNEKIEIADKAGNEIVVKSQDNSITIKCSGKVTISAKEEALIDSQAIKLGGSAGKTLVTDEFINLFNNHLHPTGNPGAPTSPPSPLHQAVKNVHSTIITKGA